MRHTWHYAIVIITIVAGAISLCHTQDLQNESQSTALTLSGAESTAVARNADVISDMADYKRASAAYLSAWSSFMPTVSTQVSWRRYDREMMDIQNDQLVSSKDSYSFGLSGSMPLFSGGKDLISLMQSKLARDASWIAYSDARAMVIADVVSVYLSLVKAKMEADIALQSFERAQDEQRIVEQRASIGSASEVDVSKMRVQVAQKKLVDIQAKNSIYRTREQLCVTLDFPIDSVFDVDTLVAPPSVGKIPPLEKYIKNKENRSIIQAKMNLKSAKLGNISSMLNYLPKLSLSASWSWSGDNPPAGFSGISDEASLSYGLSLSWTLFSGTSRIADIMSSSASYEGASVSMNKTELSAQQQIREAYRSMTESAASYEVSRTQVDDANLTLSAMKKRYELGSATLLELLDAELALEQAQLQKITAMAGFYQAEAQMKWLTEM